MGWQGRVGHAGVAGAAVLAALPLTACGGSDSSSRAAPLNTSSTSAACLYGLEALGKSPMQARAQVHQRSVCARVSHVCRRSIAFSRFRTHTNPGTYTDQPPGSCPPQELDAVLRLAASIRLSGPRGSGLCNLLVPLQRANAQRVARLDHVTCGQGAVRAGGVSYKQLSQPLSYVILFSSQPGPPHWFAYLESASPKLKTLRPHQPLPSGVPAPVNTAIVKQGGNWMIYQFGYQP